MLLECNLMTQRPNDDLSDKCLLLMYQNNSESTLIGGASDVWLLLELRVGLMKPDKMIELVEVDIFYGLWWR